MGLEIVVPGEPLGEVEVLAFDGIGGMKEDIEAPVLETVVELLDLPVVLGVVGFIFDVGDSGEGAGCGKPGSPLPSAVCANGTDDERGPRNDMAEEGNGTVLITVLEELRQSKT